VSERRSEPSETGFPRTTTRDLRTRLRQWTGGVSIQGRLVRNFSIAILIPALITTVIGVGIIRQRVFVQAQAQVNSDLEAAKEIYQSTLDGLQNAIRIHATRMVIYRALQRGDPAGLDEEMDRIRRAERFDVLTLTDAQGRVFYRTRNPGDRSLDDMTDEVLAKALKQLATVAATEVVPRDALEKESPALARQAFMTIAATPRARPRRESQIQAGMMLSVAAPVFTPAGRHLGVLVGGVLLNRNYEIVDKVRETVFKDQAYKGRPVGTATIFQDDVRISTNVRNADGTRAIATQVSAEVADEVLGRGGTWRGRAFVVNDWYLAAYTPIRNLNGTTIGMLYVGVLEQPYTDTLWRSLYVFLGIAMLGVGLVILMAVRVARRISEPIHAMAEAAQQVAGGDYSPKVQAHSQDELGYLASSFNTMTSELERAHQALTESADDLERKVEQRTAELKAMQAHMLKTEKLAAVGKLAAGVAHEINNPLTGILTNSSLMLQDLPEDHPWRDDVQTIVNETLRCRRIVKGLLDFARQTKPQRTLLAMNQVLDDVLALVRNQASFRNVRISLNLAPDLPTVLADGDQMRQVILNIVLNAAEAMPEGGELRVASRPATGQKGVEIRISDTGPGIADDVKARLFEPFFTTKKTGTGLGLAIAYGMIERHRGSLWVETAPGKGSTFVMIVPVGGASEDE
jgi:two-component system NtrC family sensor kinase